MCVYAVYLVCNYSAYLLLVLVSDPNQYIYMYILNGNETTPENDCMSNSLTGTQLLSMLTLPKLFNERKTMTHRSSNTLKPSSEKYPLCSGPHTVS